VVTRLKFEDRVGDKRPSITFSKARGWGEGQQNGLMIVEAPKGYREVDLGVN